MSHLNTSSKRGVVTFKRYRSINASSSSVASEAHKRLFARALNELIEEISSTEQDGYFYMFNEFCDQVTTATDQAFAAAIALPGALGADPTPAKPTWMKNEHYNLCVAMYGPAGTPGTQIQVALAAAGAPGPLVTVDNPVIHSDQEDFDYVFLQFLFNLCHSGATATGNYRQIIEFKMYNQPADPDFHCLAMNDVITLLPSGVTPFNIVAGYADFIVENAKSQGISFDWGRKHGAAGVPGHLTFVAWPYISDKYINEDQKEILRLASATAIRDKRKQNFMDPLFIEQAEEEDSKLAAEQLAEIYANRERLTSYNLAPQSILRRGQEEREARDRDREAFRRNLERRRE